MKGILSTKEKFKTPTAGFLILTRKNGSETEILLQCRQNTDFKDGFWDTAASGHIKTIESIYNSKERNFIL